MRGQTYLRLEILRTLRNRRFVLFSLVFPLALFVMIAAPNRALVVNGIGFPLYYMAGMTAWGSMSAVITSGARIARERSVGWTRQLRTTPLTARAYVAAKVLTGYMMALLSILVLAIAGTALGVRLDVAQWATLVTLLLLGLIPFAVLGVLLGHVVSVDSLGPVVSGVTSLFALLGGAFGPLVHSGVMVSVVKLLPSYWLVQAGHSIVGAGAWPGEAWIVVGVWTVLLTRLAVGVVRRDSARA